MNEQVVIALWMRAWGDELPVGLQRAEFEDDEINQKTWCQQSDGYREQGYHNQDDRKYARRNVKRNWLFDKRIVLECHLISSGHQSETERSQFSQLVFQSFHQKSVFQTGYH